MLARAQRSYLDGLRKRQSIGSLSQIPLELLPDGWRSRIERYHGLPFAVLRSADRDAAHQPLAVYRITAEGRLRRLNPAWPPRDNAANGSAGSGSGSGSSTGSASSRWTRRPNGARRIMDRDEMPMEKWRERMESPAPGVAPAPRGKVIATILREEQARKR